MARREETHFSMSAMHAELSHISESVVTRPQPPPRNNSGGGGYDRYLDNRSPGSFTRSGSCKPPTVDRQRQFPGSSGASVSTRTKVSVEVELEVRSSPSKGAAGSATYRGSQPSTPSRYPNHKTFSAGSPSPSSPGQRKNQAYVLFRGANPGVYKCWPELERQFDIVPKESSVFRGFETVKDADASYMLSLRSGVIKSLQDSIEVGTHSGSDVWVVTHGVDPKVYTNVYAAMREGCGWAGGTIYRFSDQQEAQTFFNRRQMKAGGVKRMEPFFPPGKYTYN